MSQQEILFEESVGDGSDAGLEQQGAGTTTTPLPSLNWKDMNRIWIMKRKGALEGAGYGKYKVREGGESVNEKSEKKPFKLNP